jgi:hypothetical protein
MALSVPKNPAAAEICHHSITEKLCDLWLNPARTGLEMVVDFIPHAGLLSLRAPAKSGAPRYRWN